MKRLLLGALMMLPMCVMAQNKDCKFQKFKDGQGNILNGVVIPAGLGNLTFYKMNGKLGGMYAQKWGVALLADQNHMIALRIDSVKFVYVDNSVITLKVTGVGSAKNSAAQLKPTFDNINFSFLIDNDATEKNFGKVALRAFIVVAEKEAQYGDDLNGKNQAKFVQGISCIENQ